MRGEEKRRDRRSVLESRVRVRVGVRIRVSVRVRVMVMVSVRIKVRACGATPPPPLLAASHPSRITERAVFFIALRGSAGAGLASGSTHQPSGRLL